MGLFSSLLGGGDEHHETPCNHRDDGGPSWVRKDYTGRNNPMGWGRNDARVVKHTGSSARSQSTLPTEHGSRMNVVGGLLRWDGTRERPAGEGPGTRR